MWWTSGFPGVRRSARTQWRNCLFISFQTHETKPFAEICLRKIGIELDRLGELRNCLLPFPVPTRKFSQNVVCASIARIDRNFLQELLPGTFRALRARHPAAREAACLTKSGCRERSGPFGLCPHTQAERVPTSPAFRGLQRSAYEQRWIAEQCGRDPGPFASIDRNRRGRRQKVRPGPWANCLLSNRMNSSRRSRDHPWPRNSERRATPACFRLHAGTWPLIACFSARNTLRGSALAPPS